MLVIDDLMKSTSLKESLASIASCFCLVLHDGVNWGTGTILGSGHSRPIVHVLSYPERCFL